MTCHDKLICHMYLPRKAITSIYKFFFLRIKYHIYPRYIYIHIYIFFFVRMYLTQIMELMEIKNLSTLLMYCACEICARSHDRYLFRIHSRHILYLQIALNRDLLYILYYLTILRASLACCTHVTWSM